MANATDEEVNTVREVAGENDDAYVLSLVGLLNDAQWERALEFVDAWAEFPAGDVLALKGGRDGVIDSDELARQDIRGRMRLLLGLSEFRDADLTGMASSRSVRQQFVW